MEHDQSDPAHAEMQAAAELLPAVYAELRRLAAVLSGRLPPGQTIQPTALVHEAYMKLVGQSSVRWQNRAHFFGIAAQMIRRILVDYARSQHAEKRGSGAIKLVLDEAMAVPQTGPNIDLLGLNDALDRLAELDERQGRIVELRFFAGLTLEETAEVMQMSIATAKRDWVSAKAWLAREIQRQSSHAS